MRGFATGAPPPPSTPRASVMDLLTLKCHLCYHIWQVEGVIREISAKYASKQPEPENKLEFQGVLGRSLRFQILLIRCPYTRVHRRLTGCILQMRMLH